MTIFVLASCFSEPGPRRAGNLVLVSEGLDLRRSDAAFGFNVVLGVVSVALE